MPRISLAATFKAKASKATHLTEDGLLASLLEPLAKQCAADAGGAGGAGGGALLPLQDRIRLIARSLLIYSDWYDLEGGALPEAFFRISQHTEATLYDV